MKALTLEKVGQLILKEKPVPELEAGMVLVKILACGICSSDIPRVFKTGTYHFPTVPGHEFSGVIVEVAPDVKRELIGRKVVVFPLLPCKNCPSCLIGEYARCDHYNYFGSRCDGGFQEYIAVPTWNLVFCPDEMPPTLAALCEPVAVAKHCIDAGDIHIGENVLVVGTGTIGLAAALWAKINGAQKVIVAGRSSRKLDFAKSLGIDVVVNSDSEDYENEILKVTENRGVDVAFECVGSSSAIRTAIVSAKKGGRVILTGNPDGDITLSKPVYWKILRNELTIRGTWNSTYKGQHDDWSVVIHFLLNEGYPFGKLITHVFALEDYEKAFATVRSSDEFSIKVMLAIEEKMK